MLAHGQRHMCRRASTNAKLCPVGVARLSPCRRALPAGSAQIQAPHACLGPSSPRQHAVPIIGLKADTLNRWKISFRQHNHGIKKQY